MERDWATLGPKLAGKLHLFVGASDTFFLTNAVMDAEDFFASTANPASDAEVGGRLGWRGGGGGAAAMTALAPAPASALAPALAPARMTVLDMSFVNGPCGAVSQVVVGAHGGRGYEHCFRGYEYAPGEGPETGALPLPNSITRLTYNQAFLPAMADHFAATAPDGADVTSWRY